MLTDEQIRFYAENGYLVMENVFSKKEVAAAIQAIEWVTTGEGAANNFELEPADKATIRRIWSPTNKHPYFWEMASNTKLLDLIQGLIGQDIQFHYSKLNMKGPKVGSIVEWHQDFSYYPHTNSDLLTALIPFDDMKLENGCLRVIPGSHKRGLQSHDINGFFRGKVSDVDESVAVDLEVPAGGVIFLHCLTLHASNQNESSQPRRTFLPAYRAGDAFPIYYGPHAAHNEPGTKMLRGKRARIARIEGQHCAMPIAEREFGSIYEIQEGSHLVKQLDEMKVSGYAVE